MRYGPQDIAEVMGIGSYVGEVRRGPDGQAYQWVEGVDGLGNLHGWWSKLKSIAKRGIPFITKVAQYVPGPYGQAIQTAGKLAQRTLGVGEIAEGADGQLYEVVEGVGEPPVQSRPVRRRVWISIPAVIHPGRGPRGMGGRRAVLPAVPGAQPAVLTPVVPGARPAMVTPAVPARAPVAPVRRFR